MDDLPSYSKISIILTFNTNSFIIVVPSRLIHTQKKYILEYTEHMAQQILQQKQIVTDLIHCILCVCVYSNSRNDVPRVAQQYGTIAAHTWRHVYVHVVFVVFCVHMHSFAGLIRRMPSPYSVTLQSPTATLIPLFSSSELTGCGYPGLLDRKNRSDVCPRWESNPQFPAYKMSTLSTKPGSPLPLYTGGLFHFYMLDESICHFRGVRPILSLLFHIVMENPVCKQCRPSSDGTL